jgi:MoxR-like ATPase
MMKVYVDYPTKAEEKEIMRRMAKTSANAQLKAILTKEEIFEIRKLVDSVSLSNRLEDYIIDIIMATRKPEDYGLKEMKSYIDFGVSPRASIALNMASKCHAFMQGRSYVMPEDIKAIAPDVLNHRIILNYEAEAEEVTTNMVTEKILRTIPLP